jgi:hypothetical protein
MMGKQYSAERKLEIFVELPDVIIVLRRKSVFY